MKSTQGWTIAAGLLVSAQLLVGVQAKAEEPPRLVDRIAAVVGSKVITLSEVGARVELSRKLGVMAGSDHIAQKKRALQELIDESLLESEILSQAVEVLDSEVEAAIGELRRQNNLDEASFARAIGMQGYTMARYREEVRSQLRRARLINSEVRAKVQVSDAEVDAALKQEGSLDGGEEIRVRHILIKLSDDASEIEQRAAEAKIAQLKQQLDEKGSDFDLLAKENSEDAGSAPEGGDLGWFAKGQMVKPFEEAAFEATPGKVVGPVRSIFGLHLIKVLARRAAPKKRNDQMRQQKRAELYQRGVEEETRRYLERLREKALIEIKVPELRT